MYVSGMGGSGSTGISQEMFEQLRASRESAPDPEEFASAIVGDRDDDGDGALSLEESGFKEDMFNSMDANGDGLLSSEELATVIQEKMDAMRQMMGGTAMLMQGMGPPPPPPEEMAASIVGELDSDGDGALTLEESGLEEEMFSSIDADGDGVITTDEIIADMEAKMAAAQQEMGAGASQGAGEQVAQQAGSASGSGDDSSSSDEEEYDEFDLNKDGQVTLDELIMAMRNGSLGVDGLLSEMGESSLAGDFSMYQRMGLAAYAQAGQAEL